MKISILLVLLLQGCAIWDRVPSPAEQEKLDRQAQALTDCHQKSVASDLWECFRLVYMD